MRNTILAALAIIFLNTAPHFVSAQDTPRGLFAVVGVEGDDMLKLRAGPGTGYKIVLGLPNGTVLRMHSCDQTGGTRWCEVSLRQSRKLKGFVSWAYLQKL